MFRKLLYIIMIFYLCSCATGSKYYSLENLNPSIISKAHYLFQDENLTLAAKIRSGGILGHFWYDFLIQNNGNNPIQLNWVYDVLNIKFSGKIYQLNKLTPITAYPNVLNPDEYVNIKFSLKSNFNKNINDIEELIFQFQDKKYLLKKNINAKWE